MKRFFLFLFLCVGFIRANAQCVKSVPFFEDFATIVAPGIPACWVVQDVNNDANSWKTGLTGGTGTNRCGVYSYSSFVSGDDWFFTPMIVPVGKCKLTFKYGSRSASYIEKLQVAMGYNTNSSSMINILATFDEINNVVTGVDGFFTHTVEFMPLDTFSIGFHALSMPDQFELYIDDITITEELVNREEMESQTPQIQLFPNPTEDKISVVSSIPSSIKLLDLTGRVLQTLPNLKTSHELNLSEYPAGIYLIEANVNRKIEVRKVVKK